MVEPSGLTAARVQGDVDALSPGRRGPYRKSAERRRRIVAAAVEVFAERGYRGATIRQIATRAGMSPSSLLHFYANKDELLWATMAHRDSIRPQGRDVTLRDRVVGQAIANEEVPHLVRLYGVLAAESAASDHPAHEYFAGRFAVLREQYAHEFAALARAGLLRPEVDPAVAAVTVVALWDGIQIQASYDPGMIRAADVLAEYFRLVLTDPQVLVTNTL